MHRLRLDPEPALHLFPCVHEQHEILLQPIAHDVEALPLS
jgi:hypothetical protein